MWRGVPMLSIRPYQPADQPQIEWLHTRTPPAGQVAWRPSPIPAEVLRIPETFARFLVAAEPIPGGEAIVGACAVADAGRAIGVPAPAFLKTDEPTARLHVMRVAPERWRLGIGRQLTLAAIEWARAQGYRAMILETTPQQTAAVALYRAMGFADAGRSMFGQYELVWFRQAL